MVLKKLSFTTKSIICGFIQILLGFFAIFILKKDFSFLIVFSIFALMCFASAFFGKNSSTKPKKYSERVYRNRRITSYAMGLFMIFMSIIGFLFDPKHSLNLIYLDSGLACLLFPE